MAAIETEITVEAPVERIWELVADHALYPEWNPLFRRAAGTISAGDRWELVVALPGIEPFTVRPTLLTATPPSGFCWEHTVLWAGLFSWRYCVELEAISPHRVKFIQRSRFGGCLAPLFTLGLGRRVAEGLERMNAAIRRWGEEGHVRCLRC